MAGYTVEEVEEEPVSNEQDFDDDDFLPLFLSACSGVTEHAEPR